MWCFDLRAAAIAALCFTAPTVGFAQDIVLSAKDVDQKVTGTLIEYDGEFFRVETEFGPVTVDARTVTCDGAACPAVAENVERFSALGDPKLTLPI